MFHYMIDTIYLSILLLKDICVFLFVGLLRIKVLVNTESCSAVSRSNTLQGETPSLEYFKQAVFRVSGTKAHLCSTLI